MTSDLSDIIIQLQALTAVVTRAVAKLCLASDLPEAALDEWRAALERDGDGMMKLAFADTNAPNDATLAAIRYASDLNDLAKQIADHFADLNNKS